MKQMIALIGCLAILSMASCSPQSSPETPTPTPTATTAPSATATVTIEPTRTSTRTPAPTATKKPTATPTAKPSATTQTAITPSPLDPAYLALLEPIKQADPAADFTAARMAYAKSEGYDPYGMKYADLKTNMYKALDNKDYDKALELANEVMQYYYLSPDAHIVAFAANDALGNSDKAEFHRYVLQGLVQSILATGDGKSMETAFDVILIEEEYLLLEWLNIPPAGQKLVGDDEHSYDLFESVDRKTNDPVKVYFNIDIPFGAFARSMQ